MNIDDPRRKHRSRLKNSLPGVCDFSHLHIKIERGFVLKPPC